MSPACRVARVAPRAVPPRHSPGELSVAPTCTPPVRIVAVPRLDDEDVRPRLVPLQAAGTYCRWVMPKVKPSPRPSCAVRDAPGVSESPSWPEGAAPLTASAGGIEGPAPGGHWRMPAGQGWRID